MDAVAMPAALQGILQEISAAVHGPDAFIVGHVLPEVIKDNGADVADGPSLTVQLQLSLENRPAVLGHLQIHGLQIVGIRLLFGKIGLDIFPPLRRR